MVRLLLSNQFSTILPFYRKPGDTHQTRPSRFFKMLFSVRKTTGKSLDLLTAKLQRNLADDIGLNSVHDSSELLLEGIWIAGEDTTNADSLRRVIELNAVRQMDFDHLRGK